MLYDIELFDEDKKCRDYNICYCHVSISSYNMRAIIDFPTSSFVAAGEGGGEQQQQQEKFIAQMSSVEELPLLNDTSAIGIAEFKANKIA
jgi:hypothetical protein